MESLFVKKHLNLFFCISNILIFIFCSGIICSKKVQAFFEIQAKFNIENRWLNMLSDNSSKNRFKAIRAFLVYPEWGLPVLRNSIRISRVERISWEMGALIGMLGDSSDVPNLLRIWNKLKGKDKSEVFLGAIERIYRNQKISEIIKPELTNLTVNFLENELSSNTEEKYFLIRYSIKNPSKSNMFLRIRTHFWGTISNENLPSEYLWLKPGEQVESKIKTVLFLSENTNNFRLDLRIWEVGSSEQLIHQTRHIPI